MSIFSKLRKPTLTAKLINKGSEAKVNLININGEQTLVLLFMTVMQVSKALRMDHRHLLNRLLALDSQIKQTEKKQAREAKYGKKNKK